MANFNAAIVKTLAKEGGASFTNSPSYLGGVKKYGITQTMYPNIDIHKLNEQQARDIYKRDYWNN